jgi:hypothetical protein
VTVVLDLDTISHASATKLGPVLSSVLTALAHAGVDSVFISQHPSDTVEANRRFACFDDALESIRARTPHTYVIAIGAADEHMAASLRDSQLGIELCACGGDRRVDPEAVREFLWWVIEARYTWPAWPPPLEPLAYTG